MFASLLLCSSTDPTPFYLSPSLSFWLNGAYVVWRWNLSHCPVEKQMIVPLRPNQMR